MIRASWVTRHGDTTRSPIWAVIDDNGATIDLTGWVVRAQLRATYDAPVDASFVVGDGIELGAATVSWDGYVVHTSTLQLYLDPPDWIAIPRPYRGVLDVEMASDGSGNPTQVHTLVECTFTAEADITRATA